MRATHSVLKSGAPICFYVISNSGELTDDDRARLASREGNEHVESRVPYDVMMSDAGFVDVEVIDVTRQYIETLIAWKEAFESNEQGLTEVLGSDEFRRRLGNRALDIEHGQDGILRRYRVFGVKP